MLSANIDKRGIKIQMKKAGKILEKVIIGLVFLYVGYNLISGQMELTVKGYIVLLVLLPVALLIGFLDRWKNKKHQERVQDAGGNLSGDTFGAVRLPMAMRWMFVVILLIFWAMMLLFSVLATEDGAFEYDPSAIVPFVVAWGILIALTLFIAVFMLVAGNEVYYDSRGITIKAICRKKAYCWQELGEAKPLGAYIVFYDRRGKKLFQVNVNYTGFSGLWELYQKKLQNNFYGVKT